MTVNDLTEKQVDILVNGSQQASYDQRANSANYDVGINGDSIVWGSKGNVSRTYTFSEQDSDYSLTDISTLDFDQNINLNGATVNWRLYSTVKVLETGYDYSFYLRDGGSNGYSASISSSSNNETETLVDKSGSGFTNLDEVIGDWSFHFDVNVTGDVDSVEHTWEIYAEIDPSVTTTGVSQS